MSSSHNQHSTSLTGSKHKCISGWRFKLLSNCNSRNTSNSVNFLFMYLFGWQYVTACCSRVSLFLIFLHIPEVKTWSYFIIGDDVSHSKYVDVDYTSFVLHEVFRYTLLHSFFPTTLYRQILFPHCFYSNDLVTGIFTNWMHVDSGTTQWKATN